MPSRPCLSEDNCLSAVWGVPCSPIIPSGYVAGVHLETVTSHGQFVESARTGLPRPCHCEGSLVPSICGNPVSSSSAAWGCAPVRALEFMNTQGDQLNSADLAPFPIVDL